VKRCKECERREATRGLNNINNIGNLEFCPNPECRVAHIVGMGPPEEMIHSLPKHEEEKKIKNATEKGCWDKILEAPSSRKTK